MNEFVIAIGLLFVIEGLVFSLMPTMVKQMAEEVLNKSESTLRMIGVIAMIIGVFAVWLVKG